MESAEFDGFLLLFEEATRLYQHGDLAKALALAEQGRSRFPDDSAPLYYLSATLKARMGDAAGAMQLLTEGIDKGYWYPDARWGSDAFDALQLSPEFQRLHALSNERESKAQAEAKFQLRIQRPEGSPAPGTGKLPSLPLVMALHGNGFSTRHDAPYWNDAAKQGWLVALPQPAQVVGYDAYAWTDYTRNASELVSQFETVRQLYPIDTDRVILAGKSQGAETAIRLALSGLINVRGFVAVVPSGSLMLHPAQWEDQVQNASRDLRGYVLVGGREPSFAAGARRLVEMLRAKGIACALDLHPSVRNEYPLNFSARLPFMIDFVLDKHDKLGLSS